MDYNKKITSETITAYSFNTEAQALDAVSVINQGEGIPADENAVTQTYTTPFEFGGSWYIIRDAVTEKYLSSPVTVEVPV